MRPVISVEHLSKAYRLGQIGTGTFTNDLKLWWAKMRGKPNPLLHIGETDHGNRDGETIWALKDVSFTVEEGEVLGIIGRNGAGKSTLLKILSRVTAPTSGRVRTKGRIASLLEVGTGFHPELTGRENIYLNGAILGMSRMEVTRKFGEIVDFSGVANFIDTPVKRYSSGMYVRLAFAVAAHLNPEILIVDEVLAVGDAEFQKKCLGKMHDVAAKEGRTVLFVSHNMSAVRRLCSSAMILESGRISCIGPTHLVVDNYVDQSTQAFKGACQEFQGAARISRPFFRSIEIRDSLGQLQSVFNFGEPFNVVLTVHNPLNTRFPVVLGVEVLDNEGTSLFTSHSNDKSGEFLELPPGDTQAVCKVSSNILMPGSYLMQLGMVDRHWSLQDFIRPDMVIRVEENGNLAKRYLLQRPGRLFLDFPWEFKRYE